MLDGTAVFWSVALHAVAATTALLIGDEPRGRVPAAEIDLFDARPLPILSQGTVAPIIDLSTRLGRPCPVLPPPEQKPRLAVLVEATSLPPLSGCLRVDATGRVEAVAFGRDMPVPARARLRALARELRFIPARRDGSAIPAWLRVSVRRSIAAEPIPVFDPLP